MLERGSIIVLYPTTVLGPCFGKGNEVLIDYIRDTLGKISDEPLRDSTWVESLRSIILLKVLLVFNSWHIKLNISGPGWRRSAPGSYTFGQNGQGHADCACGGG